MTGILAAIPPVVSANFGIVTTRHGIVTYPIAQKVFVHARKGAFRQIGAVNVHFVGRLLLTQRIPLLLNLVIPFHAGVKRGAEGVLLLGPTVVNFVTVSRPHQEPEHVLAGCFRDHICPVNVIFLEGFETSPAGGGEDASQEGGVAGRGVYRVSHCLRFLKEAIIMVVVRSVGEVPLQPPRQLWLWNEIFVGVQGGSGWLAKLGGDFGCRSGN
mmetsp:Transcript_5109/g.9151  ORF Transcript_5109/g.9151 Transcript_5109/m.9151 type:complete len:213 (+) Transcript_5109:2250-2888(+)